MHEGYPALLRKALLRKVIVVVNTLRRYLSVAPGVTAVPLKV
jgi:hypothetical protein